MKKTFIIAIDGPAGSGKSTVAKLAAKRLRFLYVDTGSMYRAITLKALKEKVGLEDKKALVDLAHRARIELKPACNSSQKVFLDGRDVTGKIRTPKITNSVSYLAKIPKVREQMVKLQRAIGRGKRAVFEGRDIGTVVFPKAEKKFFLDASFKERAKRRHKELKQEGMRISLKKLEQDIRTRDKRDTTRKAGPLKIAKDAIYIDTTNMTIDEVIDAIVAYVTK